MSRSWPRRRWLLIFLVLATGWLFWKVFHDDYGPFDGAINFHFVTLIDRQSLGYTGLPEYNRVGGYFGFYQNRWSSAGGRGYCVYDVPYWPDGDPGLGPANPLPPLVKRNEIYAFDPEIPFVVLVAGWSLWGILFARAITNRPPAGNGFEVMRAVAPATEALGRGEALGSEVGASGR